VQHPTPTDHRRTGATRRPSASADGHTDEQLLAAVREGDAAAYAVLYERYEAEARRYARSLVAAHDVDDLVAESFSKVLHALRQQRGPVDHPARYLMVTVRTTAASLYLRRARQQSVARRSVPLDEPEIGLPLTADDPLVLAFGSLLPRWQHVLWWSEVDGLSPAEVGARLGLSPGAASALAYRARRALRDAYLDLDRADP
jgi:RNA polymerase sigma factor (sigma-70 family)